MNREMTQLREQMFEEYRVLRRRSEDLNAKLNDLLEQVHEIEQENHSLYQQMWNLRELIDIMIIENCDPVMAKLKHAERAREMAESSAQSPTYPGLNRKAQSSGENSPDHTDAPVPGIFKKLVEVIRGYR